MIRRLLVLVLAAAGIYWLLRRLRPAKPAAPAGGQSTQQPARMVRDRVCNKFLPRNRAIALQIGSEERFFCSEACRDKFLKKQ